VLLAAVPVGDAAPSAPAAATPAAVAVSAPEVVFGLVASGGDGGAAGDALFLASSG